MIGFVMDQDGGMEIAISRWTFIDGYLLKWTGNKGSWKLVQSISFETRSEAMALEKKRKNFKNKDYLAAWIEKQVR